MKAKAEKKLEEAFALLWGDDASIEDFEDAIGNAIEKSTELQVLEVTVIAR